VGTRRCGHSVRALPGVRCIGHPTDFAIPQKIHYIPLVYHSTSHTFCRYSSISFSCSLRRCSLRTLSRLRSAVGVESIISKVRQRHRMNQSNLPRSGRRSGGDRRRDGYGEATTLNGRRSSDDRWGRYRHGRANECIPGSNHVSKRHTVLHWRYGPLLGPRGRRNRRHARTRVCVYQ
jgi:hypothetical protein